MWVFLPNEVDKRGDFRLTIDTPVLLCSDGGRLRLDWVVESRGIHTARVQAAPGKFKAEKFASKAQQ